MFCSFLLALFTMSQVAFGLSPMTAPCLRRGFLPYEKLMHKVMYFAEDNRKIFEDHASEFGLGQKDLEQYRSAAGLLTCPGLGPKHINGSTGNAALFETKNILVANLHALINPDTGRVRDPLTGCRFHTQDEIAAGLPGHEVEISNGRDGLLSAVKNGHAAMGSFSTNNSGNDWVVLRLKTPASNAIPFKLAQSLPSLHVCKRTIDNACPKLMAISSYDSQVRGVGNLPLGKSSIQTFDLYGLVPSSVDSGTPTQLYTNQSLMSGASASLNFLVDKDGKPVRNIETGALVPVAIAVSSGDDKNNGGEYDAGPSKRFSASIALDGPLATAIKELAGEKRISAGPLSNDLGEGI